MTTAAPTALPRHRAPRQLEQIGAALLLLTREALAVLVTRWPLVLLYALLWAGSGLAYHYGEHLAAAFLAWLGGAALAGICSSIYDDLGAR